jgi:hypothetical protein
LGLPHVFGNLLFDYREHTVSVTAGMPVLVILALVGAVAIVRTHMLAVLRLNALGALLVLPASFSILYVAQRYQSDLLPLLLLLGVPGFVAAVTWLESCTAAWRRAVVVAAAVLVALGCWTGLAVALEYQRELSAVIPVELRREYVDWQWRVADTLGVGKPAVLTGDSLPAPMQRGSLFVLGPCDGLYVSDGDHWHAVERANAAGHFLVRVDASALHQGPVALAHAGTGDDLWTVELAPAGDGRAELRETSHHRHSPTFEVGEDDVFDIVFSPDEGWITITRGDYELWATPYGDPTTEFVAGDDVQNVAVPTSLCRRVLRSVG